jgi:hypothetical protein
MRCPSNDGVEPPPLAHEAPDGRSRPPSRAGRLTVTGTPAPPTEGISDMGWVGRESGRGTGAGGEKLGLVLVVVAGRARI